MGTTISHSLQDGCYGQMEMEQGYFMTSNTKILFIWSIFLSYKLGIKCNIPWYDVYI